MKLVTKKVKAKTIVFTGAMIPYKFGASDGLFNLGSALTAVQILDDDIYIADLYLQAALFEHQEQGEVGIINNHPFLKGLELFDEETNTSFLV